MKEIVKSFLSARTAFYLAAGGLVLASLMLLVFLYGESFHLSQVKADKVGQFGDFVGGVVGSLWALAGVILFYIALHDQRMDYATNQKNLVIQNQNLKFQADNIALQTKMLESQIAEFKLQKEELEATRRVFEEQSKTQHLQRFESTFFQQMQVLRDIVVRMKLGDSSGSVCFDRIISAINAKACAINQIQPNNPDPTRLEISVRDFDQLYQRLYNEDIKHHFGHYLKLFETIIEYVENEETVDNVLKTKYYKIFASQLSQSEIRLIFVHCASTHYTHFHIYEITDFHFFYNHVDFNGLPFFKALYNKLHR